MAQTAWLPVLRTLRTRLWTGGRLIVPHAKRVFDDAGALIDDDLRERLTRFVEGFAAFCQRETGSTIGHLGSK